ncbi:NUDIX hydrolase [Motiliproteus sp. SC1-56]|uniref:NUDIX hydrolase n=1 Tax=Motiliproteus sp. SC1-56 TaxID=2799565 RepID=UPI001A8DC630|nr:NUDIX hydrolase [Motiliproteus sp. SC1-56]
MRWTPHATVACVIERDGEFLLVEEQIKGQLLLNQPAGHLEPDESLITAARRETLEETGWEVEPTSVLGIYTYRAPNGVTYLRTCFVAQPLRHHPQRALDPPVKRALWLTPDAIRQAEPRLRSPLVLQSIEDFLAGRHYPLSLFRDPIRGASPVR